MKFASPGLPLKNTKRMAATSEPCRLNQGSRTHLLFLPTKLPAQWSVAHEKLRADNVKLNLLPAGLASNQFVNHVVATSRQPAATPKRQPLGRKHQDRFLAPVRRPPRIAGPPLYETGANLLR